MLLIIVIDRLSAAIMPSVQTVAPATTSIGAIEPSGCRNITIRIRRSVASSHPNRPCMSSNISSLSAAASAGRPAMW